MFTRSVLVLAAAVLSLLAAPALGQSSTAFTYQGAISVSGAPLTGQADLRFQLFTAATSGSSVGDPIELLNVAVTNGLFTVPLDFGNAFSSGQPRWVGISVRSPAGSGGFTALTPRQPITPAPLAQGLAGISLTRGSPETLDQAQDESDNGGLNVDAFAPCWQSWTPAVTGNLTRIQLDATTAVGSSPQTLTVTVRYGRGLTGPVIGQATLVIAPPIGFAIRDVPVPNIPVQAGTVYTLVFSGQIGLGTTSAAIPGAAGNGGTSARNWWFRTYVTPSASIQASSTSTAFASVSGTAVTANTAETAATASSAPWSGLTGQAGVTTPAIGTGWQMLFTNSANSTFRGGMRLADNGFFEVTNNAAVASPSFARLASTGAWTVVSDERLKTDVTTAEGNLAAALKLRPVNFRWKGDGTEDFGLIAQEVREVLPKLVVGDEAKDSLTLNYSQLSVVAIGAIQEQQARIDALARENAELRARLAAIEAALLKLNK